MASRTFFQETSISNFFGVGVFSIDVSIFKTFFSRIKFKALHFNVFCNFEHFILYIVIHSVFLSTEEEAVLRKRFRVKL